MIWSFIILPIYDITAKKQESLVPIWKYQVPTTFCWYEWPIEGTLPQMPDPQK